MSQNKHYLLASDAGYGFIGKLEDFYAKNRAGKSTLSLPNGSKPLQPRLVTNKETDLIATVTNTGHLLITPLKEIPELAKGKGNKIINIPSARVATREEFLVDIVILQEKQTLVVMSGSKKVQLKPSDWKHFAGERGRRGLKLPRGLQKADKLSVVNS